MLNLIFLDTETTGLSDPRLVQLAYISENPSREVNQLFKPPKPIEFGAMAVSHITNEMVAEKPSFSESEVKSELLQVVEAGVVIAHNAPFDVRVLAADGVTCRRVIDTKRCAHHLFDYDGRYSLQELRYAMGLYKYIDNSKALAHDAMGDVIVLRELFSQLIVLARDKEDSSMDIYSVVEYMEALSVKPVLIKKVAFGKYGPTGSHAPVEKPFYTWGDIVKMDSDYVQWLIGSESKKPEEEQNADLLHTLKYYLP